jgi:P-type Cu+ transporter
LLELARVRTVLFDKTGTLTSSGNQLEYHGQSLSDEQWSAIRSIASHSSHPISRAIAENVAATPANNVLEFIGQGISGSALGMLVAIGSLDFITSRLSLNDLEAEAQLSDRAPRASHTAHIAIDGRYAGSFTLRSELRPGVKQMIRTLLRSGKKAKVISGDGPRDSKLLVEDFGRGNLIFNCRPEDKILRIEELQQTGEIVLMVGDGLNDAGAMGTADVAIAVTEDTATLVPACDVIVRSSAVKEIANLLDYAVSVKRVIIACFIVSIVYNIGGLTLAVMGSLTPLVAAVLMPISSLTVIAISVFGARIAIRDLHRSLITEAR